MSRKRFVTSVGDFTPAEYENALTLQYLLYLDDLPHHEEGKPNKGQFISELREDCERDAEMKSNLIRQYRNAKQHGVYLDDPLRLVKDEVGGGAMAMYRVTGGVVNKYRMSAEDQRTFRERKKRDETQLTR